VGDSFDLNLKSQSVVSQEQRGACIRDVRVLALDGRQVNVLQMGRRYVFEYYVDFNVDASNVGFGLWIRTTEGIGLGGAQTILSPSHRTKFVTASQSAQVRWEFACSLLPGAYFLSCGVTGTPDAERIIMHRIVDALMVRVAAERDGLGVGRVDFGAQPYITLTTP
jgi:lipopolysaccharide transport system ATP-binding protein